MAYQIRPSRPLDAEFRKVALDQIDRAVAELRKEEGDLHLAIHEARKRLKKLRGLVRLIRPADESLYARLNASYRDASRGLSASRDKTALIEAFDGLCGHFAEKLADAPLTTAREHLISQRDAAAARQEDIAGAIRSAILALEQSRPAIEAFQIDGGRHEPKKAGRLLASGAGKTYDKTRKALKRADKSRDAEDLHELRKHVKYHWMHLRLLGPIWPEAFAAPMELAKSIADDLGRDHDFAMLRAEIRQDSAAFGNTETLATLISLVDRRQENLQWRGLAAARRLLVDETDSFARRLAKLYRLSAQETIRSETSVSGKRESERQVS